VFTVYTEPSDMSAIRDDLANKGYSFVTAEVAMVPNTYTKVDDKETQEKLQKMLDMFEDNDDIQNVWHNWEEA
jgi:transcriptional/translational regulatory protein YebC/TACO1